MISELESKRDFTNRTQLPDISFRVRCSRVPTVRTLKSGILIMETRFTDPRDPRPKHIDVCAFGDTARDCKKIFNLQGEYTIRNISVQWFTQKYSFGNRVKPGGYVPQIRLDANAQVFTSDRVSGVGSKRGRSDLKKSRPVDLLEEARKQHFMNASRMHTKTISRVMNLVSHPKNITVRFAGYIIAIDSEGRSDSSHSVSTYRTFTVGDPGSGKDACCVRVTAWDMSDTFKELGGFRSIGKKVTVCGKIYVKEDLASKNDPGNKVGITISQGMGEIKLHTPSSSSEPKHVLRCSKNYTFYCITSRRKRGFLQMHLNRLTTYLIRSSAISSEPVVFYVRGRVESVQMVGGKNVPWYNHGGAKSAYHAGIDEKRPKPSDPRKKSKICLLCMLEVASDTEEDSPSTKRTLQMVAFDDTMRTLMKCSSRDYTATESGFWSLIRSSSGYCAKREPFFSPLAGIRSTLIGNAILPDDSGHSEGRSAPRRPDILFRCQGRLDLNKDGQCPEIKILSVHPLSDP